MDWLVSTNLGASCVGVLVMFALLCGVYTRAPDFGNSPKKADRQVEGSEEVHK